jgi:hypothetical protein
MMVSPWVGHHPKVVIEPFSAGDQVTPMDGINDNTI